MHCKSSGKSCNGKTNIRTIFFGDTVSQGTFKHIYNVGPVEKFSRWEVLLEIIRLEVLNFFEFIISLNFLVGLVGRTFFNLIITMKLIFVV